MSPESTEISNVSDHPVEVPLDYGGILDPAIRSDESGNVQALPAPEENSELPPTPTGGSVGDSFYWRSPEEERRQNALYAYVALRKEGGANNPATTTIEDALVAVAKVEAYLKG